MIMDNSLKTPYRPRYILYVAIVDYEKRVTKCDRTRFKHIPKLIRPESKIFLPQSFSSENTL